MYLKVSTPYTNASPSPLYRLNSISLRLSFISTYLCMIRLYIALLHLSVRLCLNSLASGICIPHLSHIGSGSGPSCKIVTFHFRCQHMKCSISLPGLFSLSGHISTGHSTNLNTRIKYITYFSIPPWSTSNPLFCGRTVPCYLSMW